MVRMHVCVWVWIKGGGRGMKINLTNLERVCPFETYAGADFCEDMAGGVIFVIGMTAKRES